MMLLALNNKSIESVENNGIINRVTVNSIVVSRKGKSSMRDYSKLTDEEIKAIAFKHYSDDELKARFERARKQAKEGKCRILDSHALDELFERHAIYSSHS